MFLTICPNTAFDKIFFIDEWKPGEPMRTNRFVHSVGGKGLNSAVVLSHLSIETTTIGFFAGSVGQDLMEIVESYGIRVIPVWVEGTTRTSHVIADKKNSIHSHVIVGEMIVQSEHISQLVHIYESLIDQADSVIFGGSVPKSVPPNFYTKLIPLAKARGIPALVDAQREVMIESIREKPDIVKMNREEFGWTFDKHFASINDIVREAIAFHKEQGLKNFVVTMSRDGTLAVTEGGVFLAKAPEQHPVNAAGAGDAVSSALAVKLNQGASWPEALRFASAVGAAAVLTERTGDVSMDAVTRILPQVELKVI